MIKTIALMLLLSGVANAKLLDKVSGVINDKVYTLSEIERVQNTVNIRREIAPFIYNKPNYNKKEVLNLLQNLFIIRDKLSELGYVISDDAVESRINETEKGLGLNRKELLKFLDSKGISFNEYFEILREAMEYNVFNGRVIAPLVTITDQELKNLYYKKTKNKKALSFRYKVLDFTLPKEKVLNSDYDRLPSILEKYRTTGNIPQIYRDISTNDLGSVAGEDLPKELSEILRETDEKSFSKTYVKGDIVHIFYVSKKDLADSQEFLQAKRVLYNQIFAKRSKNITANWFSRERLSYYILNNI
ncbi:MAG: hypothetical protein CME65_12350 [Halobacteriovoraceae bacterium]|nr:hypothetical protein [Halobacteriovoraceae bacterium]|tara:strand:+ start:13569 stop:14477 length:909 start_codon:yes stop_codon:yes gene_type:complete